MHTHCPHSNWRASTAHWPKVRDNDPPSKRCGGFQTIQQIHNGKSKVRSDEVACTRQNCLPRTLPHAAVFSRALRPPICQVAAEHRKHWQRLTLDSSSKHVSSAIRSKPLHAGLGSPCADYITWVVRDAGFVLPQLIQHRLRKLVHLRTIQNLRSELNNHQVCHLPAGACRRG